MYYVYKITNKINNKCYIGITNNPQRRKYQHWSPSVKHNLHLAMDKYGKENFSFEILYESESKEEALEQEENYVSQYDSFKNGYNMTPGGEWNPSLVEEIVTKRTYKLLNDKEVNQKLRHIGEDNPRANYTEEDVINIRKRRMAGERGSDVYEDYKHKDNNAGWRAGFSKIWLHDSWIDICKEFIGNYPTLDKKQYATKKKNQLSEVELEKLKEELKTGIKYNILFQNYKHKIDWNTFQSVCKKIKSN